MFEEQYLALTAAFVAALQPPPDYTVTTWAEANLVLSERNSPIPGLISFDLTPYLRFPLDKFTDRKIERIGGCFGTQTAKTTCIFCCLGYAIDHAPGPAMLLYPTQDSAKSISKDRIQPLIEDCPALAAHRTGRNDDWQLLAYTLDRMTIRFAWAQGAATIRSHPIRYLFKDETSAVQSGAWTEADNRTKAYYNRKIVEFSTPKHEGDSVWSYLGLKLREDAEQNDWASTDWDPSSATSVYWYYVACPHCRQEFRFEFAGLRWPADCPIRDLDNKGWYECPHCAGRINDNDKPGMLKHGQWRSPNPGGKWVGFHLNSIYGPWDSCWFGAIAAQYLRAKLRQDPEILADFVNSYLALPYSFEEAGATIVTPTAISEARAGYMRNQIPAPVKCLVLGADVRAEQIHFVVHGFGVDGECWRISWGILPDLPQLEDFLRDQVYRHPTGTDMKICLGGIDSRFRRTEVIPLCRRYPILKAVQGEDKILEPGTAGQVPWKPTALDRDSKGKPLVGSLMGYRVNTLYFKELIYHRLNPKTDQPRIWHSPADEDAEFDRHMQSEHEIKKRKRGSNQVVKVWVTRKGFAANHYLDATVYCMAVAHAFKLLLLTNETPIITGIAAPKPLASQRRAPFVDPKRIKF